MIDLVPIPKPIGSFILSQKDIKPSVYGNDGAYYHYRDVCTLLKRLKANPNWDAEPQEQGCPFDETETMRKI